MAEIAQTNPFYAVDLTHGGQAIKERYTAHFDVDADTDVNDVLVTDALPFPMMKDCTLLWTKTAGTWETIIADVRLTVSEDGTNWFNVGADVDAIDTSLNLNTGDVCTFDYDDKGEGHVAKYCRFEIKLVTEQTSAATSGKLKIIPHIA